MYIGIDLGTTGVKTVLYSAQGDVLGEFNKEYPLICRGTFVEQDAELWWSLSLEGIATVTEGYDPAEVKGISLSTQGISTVPVDREGGTLANAINWLDTRADREAAYIADTVGRDCLYFKTGKFPLGEYTLPKLMWLRQNEPELYMSAHKFLMPLDFLNMRFTGRAVCDYTIAGGTMAYNITEKRYDSQLLGVAGVDEYLLPQVGCMGDAVGNVLPEVARITGLSTDCQVFLGGQDQKIAAIGAGIDESSITVSFGTATAVTKLTRTLPDRVDFSRFRFNDETYSYEGVVSTSGAALKWAADTIFGGLSYKELDSLAEEAGGAGGVTFDTDLARGGTLSGITLSTTKGSIVYALFEGVSRSISDFAHRMGGADKLYVFGGGAKSRIWCRILANTANIPVTVLNTPETASRGAAIIASKGLIGPAEAAFDILPE